MHSAPSVSYPVGRSFLEGGILIAIWLSGGVAAAWWSVTQPGTARWRVGAMVGALVLTGLLAAWKWFRSPTGTLTWDGESWALTGPSRAQTGTLVVGFDLQRVLVLHFSGGGVARWLWLERSALAPRWGDLRRAVYSRATPATPLQAGSPVAKT